MDMKKILYLIALLLALRANAQWHYNSFTTNNDFDALTIATNIVQGEIQSSIQASLTLSVIEAAGGLDTNNYSLYADTNGAAAWWWTQATNYAATNVPATMVTAAQLTVDTNLMWLSATGYVGQESLAVAGTFYSNNPSSYLVPAATNNITSLGQAVVASIVSGGGFTATPIQTASGIGYTLTATGTNNVNVTNLNATSLATYGALTTNSSSWSSYVAPINDWTNAFVYTNALLKSTIAASTYQPIGSYLTAASSLNYNNVTNPPAIPSTNGLVTSDITNTFSTTNWVVSLGYTNANILFQYATTSSMAFLIAGLATPADLNSESNWLQSQITSNATAINTVWSTNQPFIGNVTVSSNMTVTLSTNAGLITALIGSWGGAVTGCQPLNSNLTSWSGVGTNQILLTTNVMTSVVAGSSVSVQQSTNSSGITCSIGATFSGQTAPWQSLSFTTPSVGTTYNGVWPMALMCAPTSLKVYYGGSAQSVSTLTANGANGFTFIDSGSVIGANKSVVVIGIDQ